MKKLLLAGLLLAPCFLAAQQVTTLDSIVIYATQTAKDSPVAHSKIDRQVLDHVAPMQNLPFALTLTPGVVAVGENGTGSGYAYLRIRGSEGSRIQVNLNGIPLNDAESQEVFWVNMPSVGDFLQSVQVQRGIGTSVNGPGAFGATVNMQTLHNNPGPYGTADLSYGSFNSRNISAGAGMGLGTDASFLPRGLGFDIRYAHGRTDGYIRNGKGNLHSLFSRLSFIRPDYSFKLYYIYGEQHTGITWEGISREDLE
ncbi:MAG TPA: TonB-dependent receptor, partial [Bacteroidales bacterium]|nr:TonB-dependent receptor [Bacteroidales bacterium]